MHWAGLGCARCSGGHGRASGTRGNQSERAELRPPQPASGGDDEEKSAAARGGRRQSHHRPLALSGPARPNCSAMARHQSGVPR